MLSHLCRLSASCLGSVGVASNKLDAITADAISWLSHWLLKLGVSVCWTCSGLLTVDPVT